MNFVEKVCANFLITLYCSIGDEKEYLRPDSIDKSKANYFDAFEHLTLKFLSCLKTFDLPNHSIKSKINTTIMTLGNLDEPEGLCNNIKLTITRLRLVNWSKSHFKQKY